MADGGGKFLKKQKETPGVETPGAKFRDKRGKA